MKNIDDQKKNSTLVVIFQSALSIIPKLSNDCQSWTLNTSFRCEQQIKPSLKFKDEEVTTYRSLKEQIRKLFSLGEKENPEWGKWDTNTLVSTEIDHYINSPLAVKNDYSVV